MKTANQQSKALKQHRPDRQTFKTTECLEASSAQPVHSRRKKRFSTQTEARNLAAVSEPPVLQKSENVVHTVAKKKKKWKKVNNNLGKETDILQLVQDQNLEHVSTDTGNSQPTVHKKSKQKRTKSCSESKALEPAVQTEEGKSEVHTATKRKRKRKGVKNRLTVSMDKTTVTNGNYPKESSSKDGFSCNWRKLSQTLNVNKPATVSDHDRQTGSRKTSASHLHRMPGKHSSNSTSNEIWFDGVDKDLLEPSSKPAKSNNENRLVKDGSFKGLTNAVAMDCEMVGIGETGSDSMVARVSIVNLMGNCIYDKYVKPTEAITDYRTAVSGIRPSDLEKGEEFKVVQKEVSDILDKRILVGHAVHNDLKVLFLTHPRKRIRDTAVYKYFRNLNKGNTPSLKCLSEKLLGVKVQVGEHNSVQDAQAAMRLYTMHKIDWEKDIKKKQSKRKNTDGKPKTVTSNVKKLTHSPTARKFSQLKI